MLRESVAEFRRQEIDDRARALDEEAASGVAEELFGKLAPLGLSSALLSEEAGGQEMDARSFCLALREVARGSAGLAALLLSHNLAVFALERSGADDAARDVAAGGGRAALAWPAGRREEEMVAPYVPGGAGSGLVVMVSGPGEVTSAATGGRASVREIERPMGWRAARPAAVSMDAGAGRAGLGEEGSAELERLALLGVGAIALGISAHAFEQARSYARERWQACDYIINHQQVRLMLASMRAGIETGEAALELAAGEAGGGKKASLARAVKTVVSDHAVSDATDAVQIHGGYGYMRDYGMELLMRDAKACQVYPRTPREELLALLGEG